MTAVRAAGLRRGDAVIWRGERRIVEVAQSDESNTGRILLHVFGLASWWSIPADTQIEATA
jgi:hypothetical protein